MADEKKVDWVAIHKQELTDFVRNFYQTSYLWRQNAYHAKWDRWERNYRNIYDPAIKAKKKGWQSCMFIPETNKNVEVITAALTKISSGKKRPIALEPRESGDELQAELNNDLMDYYLEKGEYAVNRYDTQKEAAIYGSGFMKIFWEKKWAKRRVKKPVLAGFMDSMKAATEMKMVVPGQPIGEKEQVEDVLVRNGIRYQPVHIRNIFLEPNSTDGQRLIHRDSITYGEIKRFADEGFFDEKSVKDLWMVYENDKFEEDVRPLKFEESIQDPKLPRPSFDKKHTVWEFHGPLPRKWINFDMPEDTEEQRQKANELTPGKALVASGHYFLASEEASNYSMEPPFLQLDYIRSGQTYGMGVAQIMEGLQEELNEVRNMRMDNVNLLINKVFMVVEKYLVDQTGQEVRSEPGALIRLKGSEIDDVRKVLAELQISDVPLSAFRETQELQTQIQETTAANRVTVGNTGRDVNQTLGGMELLKQAAYDRFTVYAFIIGRKFDINVAKKTMELIYQNIDDKAVERILGSVPLEDLSRVDPMNPGQLPYFPRWTFWKRQTPEDIDVCYDYVPVDVFSEENKMQKAQAMGSWGQLVMSIVPVADPKPFLEKMGRLAGLEKQDTDLVLAGISQMGPIPTPMGQGQGVPSISRPTKQTSMETSPIPGGSPMGGV